MKKSPFGFIAVLLIYAACLFYFLKDGLGFMLVPVVDYMIVILTMATTAYLRKHKVTMCYYGLVFSGYLYFMAYDSILAFNTFYQLLVWSNISIMVTHAFAQYLIVIGVLKLRD